MAVVYVYVSCTALASATRLPQRLAWSRLRAQYAGAAHARARAVDNHALRPCLAVLAVQIRRSASSALKSDGASGTCNLGAGVAACCVPPASTPCTCLSRAPRNSNGRVRLRPAQVRAVARRSVRGVGCRQTDLSSRTADRCSGRLSARRAGRSTRGKSRATAAQTRQRPLRAKTAPLARCRQNEHWARMCSERAGERCLPSCTAGRLARCRSARRAQRGAARSTR